MMQNKPIQSSILSNIASACLTTFVIFTIYSLNPIPLIQVGSTNHVSLTVEWTPAFENKIKKFAEANPETPENIPDPTNLLSSRNQQSAQPDVLSYKENMSNLPQSPGDSQNLKVVQSPKIKERTIEELLPDPIAIPSQENIPFPSGDSNQDQPAANGDGYQDRRFNYSETRKKINLSDKNGAGNPKTESKMPPKYPSNSKPRPKLANDLLNGPILMNQTSAVKIGKVSLDCRLNPYGVYMQELLKSIESQWNELIMGSFRYIQKDKFRKSVTYTFTLLKSGRILELREINQFTEISLPSELCRQAIASRAPFGEWTDQMIEEFGASDQITITFNYY